MNTEGFVAHCLELLASAGPTRARKMFGGHGLYVGEAFVAVVVDDQLFLKVNANTRPHFDAEGCRPWIYDGGDKPVTMGYSSVPDEAMDSAALMLPWARLALQAGREAAAQRKPPRQPSGQAKSLPKPPRTKR